MIKRILIRLTTLAVLLVFLTPTTSLSAPDRRTALVIGNGAYKSSPLRNPVNDATDIAYAFRNLGFSVILKTNANQKTMEDSIREFGKKLRLGGVGLFYFAGHGLQVKGRNYLLPLGANIGSEADIKYEAVDAGRVLAQMEEAENGLNIIILDACRDNPFARSFRSGGRGLAKMDAPEGSILAYATAPGSIAEDGTGRNGLYTSKLLKHIRTSGLPVELFFKEVRRDVRNESGKKQIPWTESSLVGDFYFNPKRGITVVNPPSTEPQKPIKETPKYASISPDVSKLKVIDRDGRFIAYDNETVKDTKTGLVWASKDNGENINWKDAKRYCENYRGGGYTDWRMPTKNELAGLYDKSESYQHTQRSYKVHLTELIKLSTGCPWASETRGSYAAIFYFDSGNWFWSHQSGSIDPRALPVRGGKSSFTKTEAKEIDRDGTLIAYATGVVYDKKTDLEWIAGPDRDTTWYEAESWVENLNVAGGGWRMPTTAELKSLYKKGAGSRNMTPLLKTTGWWVWSGETKGLSSAWTFKFINGYEGPNDRDNSYYRRGFAVRSRR